MARLHISTRKGLFSYGPDGTGGWTPVHQAFPGVQVSICAASADGQTLWAGLDHGHFGQKLHRSRDGGASWQEVTAPAYPPMPADAEPQLCPMRQIEVPWRVVKIWEITASPTNPDEVWLGTIPGGLFHSTDGGDSWELVHSLWDRPERLQWFGGGYDFAGIHSIAVNPTDDADVVLAVSCGGVWRTRDRGASWDVHCQGMVADYMPPEQAEEPAIQDPHRLARCPGEPDAMWVQHHNGIFRTTDGAATWTRVLEAGPSTFGFCVAVHPTQPDTAWFVPAEKDENRIPVDGEFVVTRTRDGGQSFDVLRTGLPTAPAWDIVYRHALAVAPDGETLALGSTTGNVFVTADGGDSWSALSHHLPPVYAVMFA